MEGNIFGRTSCIILAAGSSSRMGNSKALLKYSQHETFIQKITGTYVQSGVKQVIVVVNEELYNSIHELQIPLNQAVELVINPFPEKGRFYSLQTGVRKLKTGNSCFFQNIDNPFTSFEVLKLLKQHQSDGEVIIPSFQLRTGHPVLLSEAVTGKINLTPDLNTRIDQYLKKFRVVIVEMASREILVNINTLEDFRAAGF